MMQAPDVKVDVGRTEHLQKPVGESFANALTPDKKINPSQNTSPKGQ